MVIEGYYSSQIAIQKFLEGTHLKYDFSLPNFNKNFHIEKGILDEKLDIKFRESLKIFISNIIDGN